MEHKRVSEVFDQEPAHRFNVYEVDPSYMTVPQLPKACSCEALHLLSKHAFKKRMLPFVGFSFNIWRYLLKI